MEATELFDICHTLAQTGPTTEGLRQMHEVLVLACAQSTRGEGGSFGNLFSQVDFVCKRHGIAASDRIAIQTMRRHTNAPAPLERKEWLYDLRALAMLVSAVFQEGIPGALLSLLPPHNRPAERSRSARRPYVRCIVVSWTERNIMAETDEGPVAADYGPGDDGRDFGYLQKLLRPGMQLNLLDCLEKGSSLLRPRLIVVEPDFLVDISSIAACFTAYGHHPLLYTVNRLKPCPNTQAILLGNFAGAALDDQINHPSASTAHTLQRSFRQQAMRFCALKDFDGARFKRDAALQARNIAEAVKVLNPKNPLLEPSFVCERLGLQGRVDLMTADMGLLVEQKAGKNMKIEHQSHDKHGLQLESHYVQLLLYYGILRYNFGRTDQTVDIRLLYSRYPAAQGLLAVNYYRTLFREALRFRNQVVATELLIAREGFGRILPLLSPAIIYKEVKPDGYFAQYVLPGLQQLAAQLARLSPLERAYYERMMTFVYREQLYQKLGSAESRLQHSGGCASDLWQMPLAEKQETGNIVMGLTIRKREKSDEAGGYDLITLGMGAAPDPSNGGETPSPLNFRRGDMVYLYAYRGEPDVRQSILYKGTLDEITATELVVRLNDGQQNPDVFRVSTEQSWAVEHGSSDLSASSSIRSIHQFATSDPSRRALLLGQRAPQADTTLQLGRSYSPAYDHLLLKSRQARDYFLLIGPPGTGKTSQALRFMIAEELDSEGCAILLTAYTNRAVDEICSMLEGEGWPYLRVGNAASCDPRFRKRLIEQMLDTTSRLDDMRRAIQSVPIVVGTTSTLQSRQEVIDLKRFSLCIVDEASQILEPSIIGLLSHPNVGRFVLVGDYKQLPAVVSQSAEDAAVGEPCLRDICLTDCRQSLFERLIRWERHCRRTQFVGILDHQGRMHPDVALFPCRHFYQQEQLQPVPLQHQLEEALPYTAPATDRLDELLLARRVLFLDATDEARLVATLLGRIYRYTADGFDADKTVGVIVTYRQQIAQIRQQIAQLGIEALQHVSIDTVERYQGSQRDVIVYSFGVAHRYQLDFLTANTFVENGQPIDRKLNVAMTRARRQLILTGRADVLRQMPLFSEIIRDYGETI